MNVQFTIPSLVSMVNDSVMHLGDSFNDFQDDAFLPVAEHKRALIITCKSFGPGGGTPKIDLTSIALEDKVLGGHLPTCTHIMN